MNIAQPAPSGGRASRATLLKLFGATLAGAAAFSAISFFALLKLSEFTADEHRSGFLLSVAEQIEMDLRVHAGASAQSHFVPRLPSFLRGGGNSGGPGGAPRDGGSRDGGPRELNRRAIPPAEPPRDFGPPRNFRRHLPNPPPRPDFWILTPAGEIVDRSGPSELPPEFRLADVPAAPHEVVTFGTFFRVRPAPRALTLETSPPLILLSRDEHGRISERLLGYQAALTFAVLLVALGIAASLTFLYLRRKSREARAVLDRLARGELDARFEIRRVDEAGSLLLDFNRMAAEIEALVHRLRGAETARTRLLQELGHDLRTPLTSMRTAFETLREHGPRLGAEDRDSLMRMIGADIRYFGDLLDELMQVADLSLPGYRLASETVDLAAVVERETRTRETLARSKAGTDPSSPVHRTLAFRLEVASAPAGSYALLGDSLLLQRAIRNALANAERFARSEIRIRLVVESEWLSLVIEDDGPGLSPEAIESFGKRRERRELRADSVGHFSLGLGSVIMRTIAELHRGTVTAANRAAPDTGGRVEFRLLRPSRSAGNA